MWCEVINNLSSIETDILLKFKRVIHYQKYLVLKLVLKLSDIQRLFKDVSFMFILSL